jgi:hypothetical protein
MPWARSTLANVFDGVMVSWSLEARIWSYSQLCIGRDVVVAPVNDVVALDLADGHVRWTHLTGKGSQPFAALAGDVVVCGGAAPRLFALDAASGAIRWTFATAGRLVNDPVFIGGVVAAITDPNELVCLDVATGALLGRARFKGQGYALAAVGDELVVSLDGALSRHKRDAALVLRRPINHFVRWFEPGEDAIYVSAQPQHMVRGALNPRHIVQFRASDLAEEHAVPTDGTGVVRTLARQDRVLAEVVRLTRDTGIVRLRKLPSLVTFAEHPSPWNAPAPAPLGDGRWAAVLSATVPDRQRVVLLGQTGEILEAHERPIPKKSAGCAIAAADGVLIAAFGGRIERFA